MFNGDLPKAPTVDDKEAGTHEYFLDEEKLSICGTQKCPAPKVYNGLESKGGKETPMAAKVANANGKDDKVGQPSTHASGPLHCTGEALYTDDVPLPPDSLHATLIMATTCNVELLAIDPTVALATPGVRVVAVYTYEDVGRIGGDNSLGPIVHDEIRFFPIGECVPFVRQAIGVCIEESLESSETGARYLSRLNTANVRKRPL